MKTLFLLITVHLTLNGKGSRKMKYIFHWTRESPIISTNKQAIKRKPPLLVFPHYN